MKEESFVTEQWRERILKCYYIAVGAIFLTEVIIYIALLLWGGPLKQSSFTYCVLYIVCPSILNLLCVLVAEHMVKEPTPESYKNRTMILGLCGICMVVATFHGLFLVTTAVFVAPIVVSVMFDDEKLTQWTTIGCIALMFLSVFTAMLFDDTWTLRQRVSNGIATFAFVIVVSEICKILILFSEQKNKIIFGSAQMNDEMKVALRTDPMTGLFNHSEFYRLLEEGQDECKKKRQNMTVAVLDVDFFKKVNDNYGHENGDVVLIRIASILREVCSNEGSICRYGGEEFSVICQNKKADEVVALMEQVRTNLNNWRFDFMPGQQVGVSCGIYEYRGEDIPAEEIFNRADQAMYRAKNEGRNQCIRYV